MIKIDDLKKKGFSNEEIDLVKNLFVFADGGSMMEVLTSIDPTYHFENLMPVLKEDFNQYNQERIKILTRAFYWIAILSIKKLKREKNGHCGSCFMGNFIFPAIAIISSLEKKESKKYKKILKFIGEIKKEDFLVWCCDEYPDFLMRKIKEEFEK